MMTDKSSLRHATKFRQGLKCKALLFLLSFSFVAPLAFWSVEKSTNSFRLLCLWLGFPVFCIMVSSVLAQTSPAQRCTVGPPSAWVAPLTFTRPDKSADTLGEDQHLLLKDRQVNVASNELFIHIVRQIRNYSGVESGSMITIEFEPDFETLNFHWIRIWRGTNCLERLSRDKIKLIEQEPELSNLLIYGRQSAVTVLEDVRAGDIIDYAYTLRGVNPILSGRFYGQVPVQLRVPVDRLRTRLVWPAQRYLYLTNHLCSVKPVTVRRADGYEFIWDFKHLPALPLEDSLPGWYDPDPSVQLTEFPNWSAVNQWALQLFTDSTPLSPELKKKIEEWRWIGDWNERVLAVLHFVQDDVRYFGIEIGASATRPASASETYERRFGDCKDKTFLFVTILRALGVEAYPVLVNTDARHSLDDWLPTPNAFDHAIAYIRYQGHSYWLDSTVHQAGTLDNYRPPPFERGLVIAPATKGLTVIPSGAGSRTTVSEYFTLRGRGQSADLKVVTIAEGRDAERLRYLFTSTSPEAVGKRYLDFYSRYYTGIHQSDQLSYTDNEQANRVETTEYYTIDDAWQKPERGSDYSFGFYPVMFYPVISKPMDKARQMPLAVEYPRHLIQHTEVTLPVAWPGLRVDKTVNDPAFTFEKHISGGGRRIIMDFEYESLADFVPPENVPDYLDHLTTISQSLDYQLTWSF